MAIDKNKYPEAFKVEQNEEALRTATEYHEYLEDKGYDVKLETVYDWLGIDLEAYRKEVDLMLKEYQNKTIRIIP